ncbi:MAG: hypothetical protein A4E72_01894 [Syntrophus sp. PtaU1.Bin208]|nr:MAG: hypothetical protein A4E72_01894 [Syntrophus sp. PtaU1.Bin208]
MPFRIKKGTQGGKRGATPSYTGVRELGRGMGRSEFLNRFNISAESFAAAGISWDELEAIRAHYLQIRDELEPTARQIVNILHKTEKVHSVSYRIKAPEHLLAKIIRKRIGKPGQIIGLDNYQQEITDLIGIRVLHLFKEDWGGIHSFITRSWNLRKAPVAYVRRGDAAGYIDSFKRNGCRIKEHPYGYRSVHYLLKSNAAGKEQISEVQVRSLFEEAWSSIDHSVRYPYEPHNVLLNELLVILNRLAGSADELGSYILYLKKKLKTIDSAGLKDEMRNGQRGAFFQLLDEFEWPAEIGMEIPDAAVEGKEPGSSETQGGDAGAEGSKDPEKR